MAEEFAFFDPVQIAPGIWDRDYNARQFIAYFFALITTGIMKSEGEQLKVTANGANMIVSIDTGVAFVEGHYYRNKAILSHTLDTESLGRSRIDRIVVRLDMAERKVTSAVKKGVPSASPVAPTLTQTENLYEISLAQVKVVGGQTFIVIADVVDERGTDVICPWAGSNILPNFDSAGLADLIAKVDKSMNYVTSLVENENPDTTQEGMIITNHLNAPFSGEHAFITTLFYATKTGNRSQIGKNYVGTNRLAIRTCTADVWTPWEHLVTSKLPNWTPAVLRAGFSNVGGQMPLSYYKDGFGVVHLKGVAQKTGQSGSVVTDLPVGYRPNSLEATRKYPIDSGMYLEAFSGGDVATALVPSTGAMVTVDISFRTD